MDLAPHDRPPYAEAVIRPLGSLWREPRSAAAPPVSRADWLLVGGLVVAALAEGVARPDLAGQPFVTLLLLAAALGLLAFGLWSFVEARYRRV